MPPIGWQRTSTVPGFEMFKYNIYAFCGDGDLMEGVGSEAASLAGHLKLPNLCWTYDNNRITLDGPADWSFTENVSERFQGYGWNVVHVTDANDLNQLAKAYDNFLADQGSTHADRREQPHRVRIPAQARHQ